MNPPDISFKIRHISDEQRRLINSMLIGAGSPRYIADSDYQHGYRELADKCADLENGKEAAVLAERQRVVDLIENELRGQPYWDDSKDWRALEMSILDGVLRRIRDGIA